MSMVLIPVISKDFLNSVFCTDEWTSFYMRFAKSKQNSIMPIIIDDVDVPAILASRKHYNYFKEGDYQYYLMRLRQALSKIEP